MVAGSGPVGVGQVIGEALRAKEEKEKQELEAIGLIGEHVKGYLEGGPDLEAEDIELGQKLGVDLEVIRLRWKVVRKKREAAASLKNSATQPSIEESKKTTEEPKPDEPKPKMELVAYKLPNGEYKTEWVEVKPKVKPKPLPQPKEAPKSRSGKFLSLMNRM